MDILLVCHANLCRSAMAERILWHAVACSPALRGWGLTVASAGVHAHPGMAMHPVARAVLAERGIGGASFRSRRASPELLESAGVVLTAARQQRAECAALAPPAIRRTFTLVQFGWLARHVRPDRMRGLTPRQCLAVLVEQARHLQSEVPTGSGDDEDIPDPVGGTVTDMRRCAAAIQVSLRPVVALLADAARPDPAHCGSP